MKKLTLVTLSLIVLATPTFAGITQRGGSPIATQPQTKQCSAPSPTGQASAFPSSDCGSTKQEAKTTGGLLVGPPVQQPPATKTICIGSLCFTSPFSGR